MNGLHFSENILKFRRERGITQEELAQFIGVTKASISKWETGQSLPDILLLPQLASFFDVTLDEMLGYEPQLGKEQIRAFYQTFAEDFSKNDPEEVFKKSQKLVKKYYSCYPFLLQILVLWLNHFMIFSTQEKQNHVLEEIIRLGEHILSNCKDLGICAQTVSLKATAELQLGRVQDVVEELEEIQNSYQYYNNDGLLLQAYIMNGSFPKADEAAQVGIFRNISMIVEHSVQLLFLHKEDWNYCRELIRRTDCLIELYNLRRLSPNTVAIYQYHCSVMFCTYKWEEETFCRLEDFVNLGKWLAESKTCFLSDDFFPLITQWLERLDLGSTKVRESRFILDSIRQALCNPIFESLEDTKRFEALLHSLP